MRHEGRGDRPDGHRTHDRAAVREQQVARHGVFAEQPKARIGDQPASEPVQPTGERGVYALAKK